MQHRLSELIEELHDGFCSIRLDGELIYSNKSARTLLKLPDFPMLNFFSEIIRDKNLINAIKKSIENPNGLKDTECVFYSLEDEAVPLILTVNNIHDIDSTVIGLALLFKDISVIKEMNAQLLQAQKMESIGMLASGIAHEFNNLLSGILPNAELIKMTLEDDPANVGRAESIHKSAQRAGNIVKQLLSFARHDHIENNVSLNLNRAVSETLEIMGKLFGKQITVDNKLPINLPLIKIDPTRIQQIIMNLAINARDALEGVGTITFKAKAVDMLVNNSMKLAPGKYVILSVHDNGSGISEKNIERIFDPFFTTKEPGKGTGLGLSTVYGIMKNLKGEIKVTSSPEDGTQFDLYFQVSEDPEGEGENEPYYAISKKNKTILVVDDEKNIREMAKDMLEFLGYDTICVSGGEEAIKLVQNKNISLDLAIVDLIMPRMNGLKTFNALKKTDPALPIIIGSGVSALKKREAMIEMGAEEFIEKPYEIKNFSDLLDKIFVNHEA